MKKIFIFSYVMFFLTACESGSLGSILPSLSDESRLYEVKLMNGESLYTRSRPKANDDGYYRFNDLNNQRYIVNQNLVLFVEPTSVPK